MNVALGTQDQLLHVAVYEWMLQNSLFVEILQVANPSLGDFLARSVNQASINLDLADLLWKYYEKNGQHQAAAKILDKLATMPTDSIDLAKRIEYIARAVMSMRSDTIGYSVHHGEFLRDLEDKLEIAQIQKQILDTLATNRPGPSESVQVRDAVNALNSRLFNMSQLYSDFAENFNLWESQLTILTTQSRDSSTPSGVTSWRRRSAGRGVLTRESSECCRRCRVWRTSTALVHASRLVSHLKGVET